MDELQKKIVDYVEANGKTYQQIALEIHEKPEVSNYEFFASKRLADQIKSVGFEVEMPAAGHRTGFAASYKSGKPGPVMVFLAEYDALVGLGHGCGHNLFGATSSLAAAALKSVIDEVGGEVRLYGTPGEEGGENGSAKGSFVREGYFKDVDAALSAHPGVGHRLTEKTLGCVPIDIEFWGKASHAAAAPEQGINALDALIQTYNSINALRQHLSDDVRIHGIIVNGGQAPNTVPDYAAAKFYLRAAAASTLKDVYAKVERIVEASAMAMGAKGSMKPYQNWVRTWFRHHPLMRFMRRIWNCLERLQIRQESALWGSTDIGKCIPGRSGDPADHQYQRRADQGPQQGDGCGGMLTERTRFDPSRCKGSCFHSPRSDPRAGDIKKDQGRTCL